MKTLDQKEHETLFRICAVAGVSGALLTFVFGILHPKGTSNVGSVTEWMTRVHASDVWTLVHFGLIWGSVLMLIAIVGIARSFLEESAETWARLGVFAAVIATLVAVMTFLIDGAVVKEIADQWARDPQDSANLGAATLATELGFILVAGLQLTTGITALLFGIAGLISSSHPRSLGWLALATAATAIIPGSASYLFGGSTWTLSASYVSSALFGIWILIMSRRLWIPAASPA